MLGAAFALLSGAAGLGAVLAARQLGALRVRLWRPRLVHATLGAAGLVALLLALRAGALRGPFAWDAAGLVAAGLATGALVAWTTWRRRRSPGGLIVLHGTLACIGYLLLAGFALG